MNSASEFSFTMAKTTRRRVSYRQLEKMWEFLNSNRGLATGHNKTSQAREFYKRLWVNIAQSLNSQGDGAKKNWQGWCKYWNDYKSKLKKMVVTMRSSHQQTAGGQQLRPLTEIENKFLLILEQDFGSSLHGTRVEPFEDAITSQHTVAVNSETSSVFESKPVLCDDIVQPGTSGRVTPPPATPLLTTPAHITPPPATPLIKTSPHTTPSHTTLSPTTSPPTSPTRADVLFDPVNISRRSPRRRRRRRETPLTRDAARRDLIRISDRRAQIEEANKETLTKILDELREIKEILRSRYKAKTPAPAPSKTAAPRGRGRRSIFKRQPLKAPTATATVVTSDYIFFKGSYMQVGDIVSMLDVDGGTYYAQIRGFLTDQYCEKSAVVTWLLPTKASPPPEKGFDPATYIIGPEEDLPRKLEYMEFVMHAPSDYYKASNSPYPLTDSEVNNYNGFIWTSMEPKERS